MDPIEWWMNFCYLVRVRRIFKLRKTGRVLDVGCGRGLELKLLKQKGWEILGTEMFDSLLHELSKQQISAIKLDIWELNRKGVFDVVMFWHTLEHQYHPARALHAAVKLLADNGYLIIATPNFTSWESRLFGKYWFHLDVPRHLFLFSRSSLIDFMEKLDMKLVYKHSFSLEFDFFSFWQSSVNFLFPGLNNLLYQFLSGKRLSFAQNVLLLLQLPFVMIIFFLSLAVVPLLAFSGESGTMVLIFKKTAFIKNYKKIKSK